MRIGELDRRVTFQRAQETMNDLNEPELSWSDLATVWARRRDLSDGEKEAAGQLGALLISRFVVRSTAVTRALVPADRLSHEGRFWSIKGIKEADMGRNRYIEITGATDLDV